MGKYFLNLFVFYFVWLTVGGKVKNWGSRKGIFLHKNTASLLPP